MFTFLVLKRMDKFINSDCARTVQDKDEAIHSLTEEKDSTIKLLSSKEEETQQISQQLLQEKEDEYIPRHQRQSRVAEVVQVNQQLQEAEQVVDQYDKIVEIGQIGKQKPEDSSGGEEQPVANIKLKWREGKRTPFEMSRWCDAVVDDNMVYARDRNTVKIYSYNVTTDSWSPLPDCVTGSGSITVINGQLTTVGGEVSDKLLSLTREGKGTRWTEKYPPMPTKRWGTMALCTQTALIVAGGRGEGEINLVLSTVEVMNTENHPQWSTAADLPQPMHWASATVCGDHIYMLGGLNKRWALVKMVYTCSVNALLLSCVSSSKRTGTPLSDQASIWRQVASLPVKRSTCGSFHGRLLAVGGCDDSDKGTTAVYAYNSTTNSWEIISHMTTGRYSCFTAVLPINNQLMVMGGWLDPWTYADTAELARVVT